MDTSEAGGIGKKVGSEITLERIAAFQKAQEISPCNCAHHQDGTHWEDCPSQFQDEIRDAIVESHERGLREALEAACKAVDEIGDFATVAAYVGHIRRATGGSDG